MVRSYGQYKKAVKKAGGEEIATPKQYEKIKARMMKKYNKTARTSSIEKALAKSGLSQAKIRQLRDK